MTLNIALIGFKGCMFGVDEGLGGYGTAGISATYTGAKYRQYPECRFTALTTGAIEYTDGFGLAETCVVWLNVSIIPFLFLHDFFSP